MAIEGGQKIYLEEWIFKTLVSALGKSLWGGNNGPFGDSEFVAHLRYDLQPPRSLVSHGPADICVLARS
jgi:hypothetical protein